MRGGGCRGPLTTAINEYLTVLTRHPLMDLIVKLLPERRGAKVKGMVRIPVLPQWECGNRSEGLGGRGLAEGVVQVIVSPTWRSSACSKIGCSMINADITAHHTVGWKTRQMDSKRLNCNICPLLLSPPTVTFVALMTQSSGQNSRLVNR